MASNSTYEINFTDNDPAKTITITEENIDTSTDLVLFGRKRLQYGADMNQNLLSLLENFACPEDSLNPGNPNTARSNGKLVDPVIGQFWYNETRKLPYIFTKTGWVSLLSSSSIASVWGIITHGQQIPQPVGDDGYVFSYSECVWIVSPFTIDGEIFNYTLDTSSTGVVTAQLNGGSSLVVNYLIVGIKNNINAGTLSPVITPSVTPTSTTTPTPTPAAIALSTGLVSFWEFEEDGTSSFFSDSVGGNNFTRNGTVGQTITGKVGNAVQGGTTTYFVASPAQGMASGNNASYTFGGWYKINSTFTSYSNLFQRGTFGTAGQRSFTLTYTLSSDTLTLYKSSDGTAYEFIQSPANIGLKDHNWHFIVAWVDLNTLTLNIQVDNGTIYSESFSAPATFNIGNLMLGSSTGIPLQTAVDQLFYYNRTLSAAERTALYNHGNGISAATAAGLVTPTPSPTTSPTPTPMPTPTINALTVTLNTHLASGGCSGGGSSCSASTNAVFASISGGVFPYTLTWIYVAGTAATVNSPNSAQTTFQRSGNGTTLTGYYRLKVVDSANVTVYSPLVEVQTTHS